jgi:hypothetical protein
MRFLVRQITALRVSLLSLFATRQSLSSRPSPAALSNLRQMARSSGYIFDGTVLSVQSIAPIETGSVATVQITFRIEQAIRGTRVGQVLTIREWAGLWNSGERYRPGERLLLFLYSPSQLGLTIPVGGPLGRFTVDSSGNAVLENGRLPTLDLDPASRTQLRVTKTLNARTLATAIQGADAE